MFTKCTEMQNLQARNHKWRKSLETGNGAIDRQHRELLGKMSDLMLACTEGREKDEVVQLMEFLKKYVQTHFTEEEELQLQHNSPSFRTHKAQHEGLIRKLDELELQYRQEGVTLPVVANALKLTYQWLLEHIYQCDQEMAGQCRANPVH